MSNNIQCPLCDEKEKIKQELINGSDYMFECSRCGKYILTKPAFRFRDNPIHANDRYLISGYIREINEINKKDTPNEKIPVLNTDNLNNIVAQAPKDPLSKIDHLLPLQR
ncbi:MAG: hypothetical protein HY934_08230 [Candidatus Firestonebacteria bacterium]|nr:hypothetical protein [Candidatus Firestonebacteria bacterium]